VPGQSRRFQERELLPSVVDRRPPTRRGARASIPESWGAVTVTQYRIDASNDLKVVNAKQFTAADRGAQGSLKVSGKWLRASPRNDDPKGAAQGADLIVVSDDSAGL
jgi:hypothetical protein